jgi:hypothetical protein
MERLNTHETQQNNYVPASPGLSGLPINWGWSR